ncbi:MAG: SH3 domain-containing protein [Caulobacter sp.]|nr:SH3 domain-containing protein [Caulobacter sp.]
MTKVFDSQFAWAGLALSMAAALGSVPVAATAAQSGPFACAAAGQKQEKGALLGAVLGGLLGSQVSKNERAAGAVVGAGLGAAVGSYAGCNAQVKEAYAAGTYQSGGRTLAGYVQPARFERAGGQFAVTTRVNLRAGPTTSARSVGMLAPGERFQALATANGGRWVLVGRNGVGVGYVARAYVTPTGYQRAAYGD